MLRGGKWCRFWAIYETNPRDNILMLKITLGSKCIWLQCEAGHFTTLKMTLGSV